MRIAILILLICLAPASRAVAQSADPQTEDDKILYSLGLALSKNLQIMELSEKEASFVLSGLSDGILGNEPKVDLAAFGPKIDPMLRARAEAAAKRQEAAGASFREQAAQETGAVTTESGLIYREIQPGQGAIPSATDTVKVHYHGTLPDGTVFDSTRDRDPVSFGLQRVIPCFSEGLQKMKVGGKSKLTCAPDLAYGSRGAPPSIGPGATLAFEVELLEVTGVFEAPSPAPELP